jgi:hypothetical protein
MSVPSNPTVTTIVTEGLKRGGRVNPSSTQITEATEHALREVKSDIMRVAATHPYLQLTATSNTFVGEQRYSLPTDCNVFVSLTLLDGPDDFRGTAQAGSTSSTIVLDSDFPAADDEIIGRYILITAGTGVGQYRQTRDYVQSTKVATISPVWTTTPDTTSEFLAVTANHYLWPKDMAKDFDLIENNTDRGRPRMASIFADEFNLFYVPDKVYGLLFKYYADLDQLNDTGDVFVNLLREWRSVWIQGIAVKTMQRYDEDRYFQELAVYQAMLDQLANQSCTIGQVTFRDLV